MCVFDWVYVVCVCVCVGDVTVLEFVRVCVLYVCVCVWGACCASACVGVRLCVY